MTYKIIKTLTAVALFVCAFFALLVLHGHVMFYQEQHHLFLYSGQYIADTIRSEGFITLLGAFVIQFYHIPWIGAAIVASLMTAVYLLTESIISRLTGLRDMLQLGVALAVGLYFTLDSIEETPGWLVTVTFCLFIIWIVALIVRPQSKVLSSPLPVFKWVTMILFAAIWLGGGYYMIVRDYNRAERAMLRVHKAYLDGDMDMTIRLSSQYLDTGRNNRLMLYLRNAALARKGQLVDHMFDNPLNHGMNDLVFPWKSDSRESEYGNISHELTGNLNAAHHWAFEAMTIWGETAPHLMDLARYNIAMGRPKVAQRFVNKLNSSLFYRDEARILQRQIDGLDPPELHYAWEGRKEPTIRFVNVSNPVRDLMAIVEADSANNVARQYLTALLLAANDQNAIVSTVARKGVADYSAVEEAKLIYSLYPDATPLEDMGLILTDEVQTRYGRMRQYMSRGDRQGLKNEFGKSFWYYIYNYCPYGADRHNSIPSDTIVPGAALKH